MTAKLVTAAQQRMLDMITKHARADGWAEWDHVYPDWEPLNVPPQFGGKAAQLVVGALERKGLIEWQPGKLRRKGA